MQQVMDLPAASHRQVVDLPQTSLRPASFRLVKGRKHFIQHLFMGQPAKHITVLLATHTFIHEWIIGSRLISSNGMWKLGDPLTMCAIPEHFCDGVGWLAHEEGCIKCSPRLPLPYLTSKSRTYSRQVANKFQTCPRHAVTNITH